MWKCEWEIWMLKKRYSVHTFGNMYCALLCACTLALLYAYIIHDRLRNSFSFFCCCCCSLIWSHPVDDQSRLSSLQNKWKYGQRKKSVDQSIANVAAELYFIHEHWAWALAGEYWIAVGVKFLYIISFSQWTAHTHTFWNKHGIRIQFKHVLIL